MGSIISGSSSNAYIIFVSVFAVIAALTCAILSVIFITPDSKRAKLPGFFRFIHDLFNFKFLLIEKVMKFFYIFSTLFCIIYGFFSLFAFESSYSYFGGSSMRWVGFRGLIIMILGPIALRLVYEGIMLLILLVKNVIEINNGLKNDKDEKSIFADSIKNTIETSVAEPVPTAEPVKEVSNEKVCPNCGSAVTSDAVFCSGCGQKI